MWHINYSLYSWRALIRNDVPVLCTRFHIPWKFMIRIEGADLHITCFLQILFSIFPAFWYPDYNVGSYKVGLSKRFGSHVCPFYWQTAYTIIVRWKGWGRRRKTQEPRKEQEKEFETVFQRLRNMETNGLVHNTVWVRANVSGIHGNEEKPPNAPMFTGAVLKLQRVPCWRNRKCSHCHSRSIFTKGRC